MKKVFYLFACTSLLVMANTTYAQDTLDSHEDKIELTETQMDQVTGGYFGSWTRTQASTSATNISYSYTPYNNRSSSRSRLIIFGSSRL